jgi:hypothetical protein
LFDENTQHTIVKLIYRYNVSIKAETNTFSQKLSNSNRNFLKNHENFFYFFLLENFEGKKNTYIENGKNHKLNIGALTYINISPFPNLTKKTRIKLKKGQKQSKEMTHISGNSRAKQGITVLHLGNSPPPITKTT